MPGIRYAGSSASRNLTIGTLAALACDAALGEELKGIG
jgi:hypothetical protein